MLPKIPHSILRNQLLIPLDQLLPVFRSFHPRSGPSSPAVAYSYAELISLLTCNQNSLKRHHTDRWSSPNNSCLGHFHTHIRTCCTPRRYGAITIISFICQRQRATSSRYLKSDNRSFRAQANGTFLKVKPTTASLCLGIEQVVLSTRRNGKWFSAFHQETRGN